MELFKIDGTLKKRSALLAHYNDYLVANAKQAYEADMKAQHASLFPETVEATEMVEDEEVTKRVPNPDYVSYSEWTAETVVVTKAKKAIIKDGMEASPAIAEVTKLVREFIVPESVGDVELDAYLKTRYAECRKAEYPNIAELADAMVKGDQVAIEAYKAKCLAVKAKYPK